MKRAKKILSFGLCILILFSYVVPVTAASVSVISVGSMEGAPGSSVIVPISIDRNSGFVSLSMYITYDTSALTLVSVHDTGVINGAYHEPYYDSPYYLIWDNDISTTNNTATGVIVELEFLINDNARKTDYSINIQMDRDGSLDKNGNEVDFTLNSGVITVKEPEHKCDFTDWDEYNSKKHFRTCDECGEIEYASHNWDDGQVVAEPTHEDDGEIEYTCEDCGAKKTADIDAEGHDWSDWVELDAKKHERSCSCGEVEKESHYWDDGVVIQQPTATKPGIKEYTCEDCEATRMEPILSDTISVDGVTLNKTSESLKIGNSVSLIANVTPSNATNKNVVWTSSNSAVASVVDGVVTAKKAGMAVITATTVDGGFAATCVVIVEDPQPETIPVTGITLDKTDVTVTVGQNIPLEAIVQPGNATNQLVNWTTSDELIAGILWSGENRQNGLIRAKKQGTVTITATTADGNFTATCTVEVVEERTIVGYNWYVDTMRHKVIYSDGTYDMEDCAPSNCICGRPETILPEISASIEISSAEAMPGETITVDVKISDNPGLASLVLKLSYDQSLLTLTNVAYHTGMGGQTVPPASLTSPVTLYWVNGFANYTGNGIFATLTFKVSENATDGATADITASYKPDDVFNIEDKSVGLNITSGKITVIDYVPGDINGDGILNNKDVTRFMQYNAGWDVEVNEAALDVNGDGSVNNKDVTRLMQYNAGWNVEIH